MYKLECSIIEDTKGEMTGTVPSPAVLGSLLDTILKQAEILMNTYEQLKKPVSSDTDYYSMLYDASEAFQDIDKDELRNISMMYQFGSVYSVNAGWIMSALNNLIGSPVDESINAGVVYDTLTNLFETGEELSQDDLAYLTSELYDIFAAMFNEVAMTYHLTDYLNSDDITKESVTRGVNELMKKRNLSIEELASYVCGICTKYPYVANEVDKDPEVSKVVRSKVPENLVEEFEDIIELLTKEQVEAIYTGRQQITQSFIDRVAGEEDTDTSTATRAGTGLTEFEKNAKFEKVVLHE